MIDMPFIVVKDPETNIWEDNPGLDLISEFKAFKKKEGAERSSNILKAIYYIWDPKSDQRDSGISQEKLMADMAENLVGDKGLNWDDYEDIKDVYLKYNISKIESLLLHYEAEIESLNDLLATWKWGKEDIKEKSFAVAQYKTLFESLMDISERAKAEADDEMEMRAGYQKSMIEGYGDE